MEPKGSLPHLKAPATCPYPEPDESNPRLPIPLPEAHFIYIIFFLQRRLSEGISILLNKF